MGKTTKPKGGCHAPQIMCSTVMGERGQLVIPKEIRECYNLKVGDRFIIFGHGQGPIALLPAEKMHDFIEHINKQIHNMLEE